MSPERGVLKFHTWSSVQASSEYQPASVYRARVTPVGSVTVSPQVLFCGGTDVPPLESKVTVTALGTQMAKSSMSSVTGSLSSVHSCPSLVFQYAKLLQSFVRSCGPLANSPSFTVSVKSGWPLLRWKVTVWRAIHLA